ncbi:hypothetical protein ACBR40_45580 [Nonomuraea sp. AD125B]|uniref:hypothetical protein n=1 Tax=Nonomuraea sp. AD125B TaxID=3242897 RepID=UPI0035295D2B
MATARWTCSTRPAGPVLAATTTLSAGLNGLQQALLRHTDALTVVRDDAVTRIAVAEQAAAEARTAAVTAEGERERAVRAAAAAAREREQAVEAKRVAERMVRDASLSASGR